MKKNVAKSGLFALIFVLGFSMTSCNQNNRQRGAGQQGVPMQTVTEGATDIIYQAQISSLNENANEGRSISGNVTLKILGDQLQITVEASGLEPNMMHLQHLHGSKEGGDTNCPDSGADTNDDQIVDITEAYEVAGVTMIPFHENPSSMEIDTETYPTADESGNILYQEVVDLNELRNSFNEKFDGEELDFSRFTYLIHGVQEEAVPETVESVKGLPAHVTLPVGCAKLNEE